MAESTEVDEGLIPTSEHEKEQSEPDRVSVWRRIPLRVYRWTPTGTISGILYIAHGVGEYMGRYDTLGQALADRGILVFGHDHVGHGESGGDRVHINTFNTYVQDVVEHVKDVKEENEGKPVYLMGHSMGGVIAILAALENKDLFDKVVLSAASVEVKPSGPVVEFMIKILAIVAPQLGVKCVDPAWISSIEEEVEEYRNDPLIYHGALKAKWTHELFQAISIVRDRVQEIVVPVLIFHGEDDQLVPISASEFIESEIGSEDKKFERYPENLHEVLRDQAQEEARVAIGNFLTGTDSGESKSKE